MYVTKSMPRINSLVEGIVKLEATEQGLDIILHPSGVPIKEISLTWDFDTTNYKKMLSDSWGVARGDLGWKDVTEAKRAEWYFTLNDGESSYCFGVKTGCNSFCSWIIEDKSITLVCDVRNGGEGVELVEPLLCATVVSTESYNAEPVYETIKRFCRIMCEKPKLKGSPIYGFNTWYHTYGDISKKSVLKDAELCSLLASGRVEGAPLPYMVIDEGWANSRVPRIFNGGPYAPNDKFGDMKVVAEEIADKGCAPGIWFRPLCVRAELCESIPKSCYSENQEFSHDSNGIGTILDPTTENVKEYIFSLVRGLADSGYRLFKHDFTSPDFMGDPFISPKLTKDGWHLQDRTKTNAQILMELYQLIEDAANGAVVIGCNTYNHLTAGIHAISRIGCDTSGKEWAVTKKNGINSLVYRLAQNNTFFTIDADCAAFTNDVPTDKNILFADLIARSNSALFVSAAPGILNNKDIERLIGIYRISSMSKNEFIPLDWMDKSTPERFLWEGKEYNYNWD